MEPEILILSFVTQFKNLEDYPIWNKKVPIDMKVLMVAHALLGFLI